MIKKKISKKPLNIAQRVELLLKHGVDNPAKWATIHGYEEPDDAPVGGDAWQDKWQRLRKHHLEETNFLFDVIREMREQILSMDEQLDKKFSKVEA